jgi:hypothetical protein
MQSLKLKTKKHTSLTRLTRPVLGARASFLIVEDITSTTVHAAKSHAAQFFTCKN